MQTSSVYENRSYNYLRLRQAMGFIGILLPFVLVIGGYFLFDAETPFLQKSISHYFHTTMGRVFIGSLCAVSTFLFFYAGYNPTENLLASIAAFFGICTAWIPVTPVGFDTPGIIHLGSALIFLSILAVFSLLFFPKSALEKELSPQKKKRNVIYRVCGIIMFVCLVAIGAYEVFKPEDFQSSFTFFAEAIALISFGLSWLTKGKTLFPD